MLEILQARGSVSASELAGRLEVSTRTVQRYIQRLQDLGVPVDSTRGRGAEYHLRPGFRMQPILFNNEEAFAVSLGLRALQHIGLASLAPMLSGVEAKLERTVPVAIWEQMKSVSAALQLERQDWVNPVRADLIAEVGRAIQDHVELTLHYQNRADVRSERTVRPLGLVRESGSWFLAAYCCSRQDLRLFRVDRILTATRTATQFAYDPAFDVRTFVSERLQRVPARWQAEVWLALTLATFPFDLLPARASLEEDSDGLVLKVNVDDLDRLAAQVLALGAAFKVRAPTELKAAFGRLAARAKAINARGRGDPQALSG